MPRSMRTRQPSAILSSGNYVVDVPKLPKTTSKLPDSTTKLRSKKGSSTKLSNMDVLSSMRSPVLRDRTNLTKEPTTKLDVLKKGLEVKDVAKVETVTGMRTRRSKATKSNINQGTENVEIIGTKTKDDIQGTNKTGRVQRIKKPVIPSTSNSQPATDISENDEEIVNTKNVVRKVKSSEDTKKKSAVLETKRTKKTVVKQQSETVKKTRPLRKSVKDDEPESVCSKLTRNKSRGLTVSASTRKTIGNRSVKRTTRLSANISVDEAPKANGVKKFFKSKLKAPSNLPAHSKITPLKKRIVSNNQKGVTTQKNTKKTAASKLGTSFRLKQQTLQESFAKQPKILRRRKILKNYCEESELFDKSENMIEMKNADRKKGPVYKLLNNSDDKNTDKDKVYEFVFDRNDSKERARKKRKKRIVRKAPAKKTKLALKESESKPSSSSDLPLKRIIKPPTTIDHDVPANQINDNNNAKRDNTITTVTAEIHVPPSELSHCEGKSFPVTPRIVSNDALQGERRISLTVTPLQPRSVNNESISSNIPNKFNLRPSAQFKTMMDASLLRRSLSPIPNDIPKENIELDNPWRVPPSCTFSRVKNVFQSTPQGKKFGTLLGKAALNNEMTPKPQQLKMKKIIERNDENANISLTNKSPDKIQTMNTSKSPRKFGTVISNINNNSPIKRQSVQMNSSKSPRMFGTVISNNNESSRSPITNERTRPLTNVERSTKHSTINTSFPNYDEITSLESEFPPDKENSEPNNESLNEKTEIIDPPPVTPLRSKDNQKPAKPKSLETLHPQSGPSASQKSKSPDTWNLKQSNLNKFLALPDMPSSTRISTAHGIFDDTHSTPIVGKAMKETTIKTPDVGNAFGFDDDDTNDGDVSSINRYSPIKLPPIQSKINPEKVPASAKSHDKPVDALPPVRFSMGEVKKKLIANKAVENEKTNTECQKENVPVTYENSADTKKKEVIKAIEFSDTFDNIIDDVGGENVKEIPLFVDMEPVHFTRPPRFSYTYKRKRKLSWNTSGETEDDEAHEEVQKRTKKKRVGKAEREQKKILDEWAKSINNTFEEIEHFDLVVE